MTKDEALKLALEALEYFSDTSPAMAGKAHAEDAITAIKQARSAPVQEPVWIQPDHLQKAQKAPFLCRVEPNKRDDFVPLYTTPPAQRQRVVFPTMIRKMWSGGEVQAWLDENVNKENT